MGAYPTKANRQKSTSTSAGLEAGTLSTSLTELAWAKSSMQGWRPSMEDADILEIGFDGPETHLFGVFDGHGGAEVSQFCEKYFPSLLRYVLKESPRPSDSKEKEDEYFKTALTECFLRLDRLIETPAGLKSLDGLVQTGSLPLRDDTSDDEQGDPFCPVRPSTAGATGIVCLMVGTKLYVANAGDSRCVLCRQKTNFNLSRDHKPEDPIEYKRITSAGGIVSDGRVGGSLNLSRAFGDFEFKQNRGKSQQEQMVVALPDLQTEVINDATDEFLVLACDGLFERLTWTSLVEFIRENLAKGHSVDRVCEMTLDHCCAPSFGMLGTDNMTLQVILLPTTACKTLITEGQEWAAANPQPEPIPEVLRPSNLMSPVLVRKDTPSQSESSGSESDDPLEEADDLGPDA